MDTYKTTSTLKNENLRLWRMLEVKMKEIARLEELYDKLQDDFLCLYKYGYERFSDKKHKK